MNVSKINNFDIDNFGVVDINVNNKWKEAEG